MKINIKNGAVTLGINTVLEEINIDINDHDKIAIVGRNGAGKTTLLRAIINPSMLEKGLGEDDFNVTIMGKFKIGYLEQITFSNENISLIEEIKKVFSDLINMENRINNLVEEMNTNNSSKIIEEYTELVENYKLQGGYSYQKEYESLLKKFGFNEEDKEKMLKEFSGGERTKIAFIKLLLSKPDLLILDEPTNHLDIKTIEALEDYLKDYPKTLIIVSHDRMFLDNIVDTVYEIDYGKTYKYKGNYSNYEKEKKLRYEKTLKDYEFQQKEIKRLRSIYERFRFKPTKAKMALSKLKQIERMDLIEKPRKEDLKTFQTNLKEIPKSSQMVMNLKDLTIGYDKELATLNLEILRGEKLAIIGENGIGKSTLIKTMAGLIKPLKGDILYGTNLNIGYFDQNLAMQSNDNTVIEEFRSELSDLSYEEARKALGSFLFKDTDVDKKINVLSGGEKVRLQLCKILYHKPNVLILDEPTNHMDIIGKEHLEDILKDYPGTLIFVTHDRYLVNKVATSVLALESNKVKYYPYGYQEYLEKREVQEEKEKLKKEKVKVNSYNLNKELKQVEKEITKNEKELNELKMKIYDEEVYSNNKKLQEVNEQIANLTKELEDLNKTWEEIINKMEI